MVKQSLGAQRFDAVYVGTGDKEDPLKTDNADLFFMIKDFDTGLSVPSSTQTIEYASGVFYDITDNLIQQGSEQERADALTRLTNRKGWVLKIGDSDQRLGEKVVSSPSVYFNTLTFGTYSPIYNTSDCKPPGAGSTYIMDARDGRFVADLNYDGTVNSADGRVMTDFTSRGFPGRAGLVIRDGKLYLYMGRPGDTGDSRSLGKTGVSLRSYWFQEPEK